MEIVNCEIALGGDKRNTVPRSGVSVAEVAVLRAIHGDDAVFNIEPAGTAAISHRTELQRLYETYKARDEDNKLIVQQVYPGASARLVDSVAELSLPDELFKPLTRARSAPAPAAATGKRGKKTAAEAQEEPEAPAETNDDLLE